MPSNAKNSELRFVPWLSDFTTQRKIATSVAAHAEGLSIRTMTNLDLHHQCLTRHSKSTS
jgi:hypothetical protein